MESYIKIDGWNAYIRFSSAHIISDYKKCGRLHGHTYAVHTKVVGEPDKDGIIIDFSLLKETLRDIVSILDHKILIPENSSLIVIEKEKDRIKLESQKKRYIFPLNDCVLLPIGSTSAENLAQYILDKLLERFPLLKRIKSIEIGVDEGFGQGARIRKNLKT